MSVRRLIACLALMGALMTSIGCCCHKHKHACSPCGGGTACYASPAARIVPPATPSRCRGKGVKPFDSRK
jgi:hypothetical protein